MARRLDGQEEEDGQGYPVGNGGNDAPVYGDRTGLGDAHGHGDYNPNTDFDPTGGNSETPRERASNVSPSANSNVSSTPKKPMTPQIGAGSVEQHGDDTASGQFSSRPSGLGGSTSQGVIPFQPMSSGPMGAPGGSKSTLFGMAGGLKGGGLGVPSIGSGGDTAGQSSSLIDSLMAILKQKKGGMF